MIHSDDNSSWYESLDETKADGLSPVKAITLYYLFRLKGRTSIITLDNIEPIFPVKYLLFSQAENRYYIKELREYQLREFLDLVYNGSDPFINNFVNWIADGNVYLLYTKEMVEDMTAMLIRVHNAKLSVKGKLSYPLFLDILELTVKYEDYKDFAKDLTGYRTVCHTFDQGLEELWRKAIK